MATDKRAEIDEIGFFTPEMTPVDELTPARSATSIAGIKDVARRASATR